MLLHIVTRIITSLHEFIFIGQDCADCVVAGGEDTVPVLFKSGVPSGAFKLPCVPAKNNKLPLI